MFRCLRALRALVIAAVAGGLSGAPASAGAAAQGSISIKSLDGQVLVEGQAVASTSGIFDVKLSIVREGAAGRAATDQGSTLTLSAGESRSVGQAAFNLEKGDVLFVTIEIRQNGEIISRASSDLRL